MQEDIMKGILKRTVSALVLGSTIMGGATLAGAFDKAVQVDPATMKTGEIVHVLTGTKVSKEQVIDAVAQSRVIYVGEAHDNPESHRVQLEVIRALNEKFPGKIAVGMEMFRRDAQPALDAWNAGKLSDAGFGKLYCQNWGDWYSAYAPLFDYMKEQSIPVIGLQATPSTKNAVLKGRTHDDDPSIPVLDLTDPDHKKLNMEVYNQYFAGDGNHATDPAVFYRMMTFWDEAMAQTAAEFLDDPANADKKLIVLAGDGHEVYGLGIPKRTDRRHPHAYSIILPTSADGTENTENPLTMAEKSAKLPLARSDFSWKIQDAHVLPGQCKKQPMP
jgi:uncharacterized iron-regulated protein